MVLCMSKSCSTFAGILAWNGLMWANVVEMRIIWGDWYGN